MFGWSIMARACSSAWKRAMTCRVSIPGLMIFKATRRSTGSALLGHVDHAHAALADFLEQLVGADDGAGLLGDGLVDGRDLLTSPPPAPPGSCRPAREL